MSFKRPALLNLRERTTYEAWLLEEVYKITDQRIAVEDADEIIYPPTGAPPTQTIYGVGSINLGDWRPGFLNAGAPLILPFMQALSLFAEPLFTIAIFRRRLAKSKWQVQKAVSYFPRYQSALRSCEHWRRLQFRSFAFWKVRGL